MRVTSFLKKRVVRAGLEALAAVHADRLLAPLGQWRGVVLTMHRVRPAGTDPFQPNGHLEITPDFLAAVIERLRRTKVALVGLEEAADRLRARARERFGVLTFDDGYRDNHDFAWPVLRRLGVPFTVFVASGMVDGTASAWWLTLEAVLRRTDRLVLPPGLGGRVFDLADPRSRYRAFAAVAGRLASLTEADRAAAVRALAAAHGVDIAALLRREMMSWTEIRALSADPAVTIGGHTVDHPSLARLCDAEARREIVGGLDRIEAETGRRPRVFAYPFGSARDVSARDMALVRDLGISVAVTTTLGMLSDRTASTVAWPRLSLNGHFQETRHFDMLVSGVPLLSDRSLLPAGA